MIGAVIGDVPLADRAHQLAGRIDDARHLDADEVEPIGDALLDDRRDPGVGPGEELVQVSERLGSGDLVDVDVTKSADCVGGFSGRRSRRCRPVRRRLRVSSMSFL